MFNKIEEDLERELSCPICFELMVDPQDTFCGHTFCEKCLTLSMLSKVSCPICRVNIGSQGLYPNKSLASIISKLVEIQAEGIQEGYKDKVKEVREWDENRRVGDLAVDAEIDVKDTENIWCIGIVKEIIKNKNHSDTLLIHYKGWNEIYDEFICSNSKRLAPLGFYTGRPGELSRYTQVLASQREQQHDGLHRGRRAREQSSQHDLHKRDHQRTTKQKEERAFQSKF